MKMVLLGDDSELGWEKAERVRKNIFIENANVRGRKVKLKYLYFVVLLNINIVKPRSLYYHYCL